MNRRHAIASLHTMHPDPGCARRRPSCTGNALVTVMVVLSLIVVLATTLSDGATARHMEQRWQHERIATRHAAESAANLAYGYFQSHWRALTDPHTDPAPGLGTADHLLADGARIAVPLAIYTAAATMTVDQARLAATIIRTGDQPPATASYLIVGTAVTGDRHRDPHTYHRYRVEMTLSADPTATPTEPHRWRVTGWRAIPAPRPSPP